MDAADAESLLLADISRSRRTASLCAFFDLSHTIAFMKNAQEMRAEDRYRLLTWRLLQDAGLVSRKMPLPPRKPEPE